MGWTLKLAWLGTTFEWLNVSVKVTEAFDLFVQSPRVRSVSFSDLHFPSDINPADLILNKGHRLVGATAWLELDDVEYFRGTVDRPRFGGVNDAVSFNVSEEPWKDSALFPPTFMVTRQVQVEASELPDRERERIDAYNARVEQLNAEGATHGFTEIETLPYTVPKQFGRTYPIVFGAPGAAGEQPGSPAIMIDDGTGVAAKLMIAGHAVPDSTTTVKIWGPDSNGDLVSTSGLAVTHETDEQNRTIAVVDISGAIGSLDATRTDDEWYVEWNDGGALDGGLGSVLELLLNVSSIRMDRARIRGLRDTLNRFQLDGFIDDVATPWEYIQKNILPIVPLVPVQGRDGLYWVLWDPTQFEIVDTMVEGPEVVIDTEAQIEFSDIEPKSQIRIEYRYRPDTNATTKVATTHAGTSAYCALAAQRRDTGGHALHTEIVDATDTAGAFTTLWAAIFAFPPALIVAACSRARYGHRRPGDVVALTIPSLSLSSFPALISAISFDGSPIVDMELSLLTDPIIRA